MIEVIDNAISLENQKTIQRIINQQDFLWMCVDTVNYSKDYTTKYQPNKKQFQHDLFVRGESVSDYSEVIFNNLNLEEFGEYKILRAKVNLNIPGKKKYFITPHTDANVSAAKSIIYYVNDSDGPTVIFNDKTSSNQRPRFWWKKTNIFPKMGRMVKFPSNTLHSGNIPCLFESRIVINIVLIPSYYKILN